MKGCYTCERRRIQCDRTSPSCHKCLKKGLVCPGYGQRLKWAGGAAFRGRLAQLQDAASPGSEAGASSAVRSPSVVHEWMRDSSFESLNRNTLRKLVDHWEKNIACQMVWVDSPDNPYRVRVAPLAYAVPVVGLAMAAVSSQHASSPIGDAQLSERSRNEAVNMISDYIRKVTARVMAGHDLGGELNNESVEWVLAAMLLLSCYEMTDSGAAAADFHRRAARSLVNTFETTGHGGGALFGFLRNQLAIHDILACTTSFNLSTMQDVILPDRDDQTILFSRYLVLLFDITLLSRQLAPSRARSLRLGLALNHVQAEFEIARGETLMASGRVAIEPRARRRDFICVVNMTHYAALLYAARCLELDNEHACQAYLNSLFDQLATMTAPEEWLHCIAWSLFIAGVECHGDPARQGIILGLYDHLYEKMRFRNFRDALHFLRVFWAGAARDWRGMAREWEVAGHPVLLP